MNGSMAIPTGAVLAVLPGKQAGSRLLTRGGAAHAGAHIVDRVQRRFGESALGEGSNQ